MLWLPYTSKNNLIVLIKIILNYEINIEIILNNKKLFSPEQGTVSIRGVSEKTYSGAFQSRVEIGRHVEF